MSNWVTYNRDETCYRDKDCIFIRRFDRSVFVLAFISEVNTGLKEGYDDFWIDFSECKQSFYPNVVVPFVGMLNHYKRLGVKFEYNKIPPTLISTGFLQPKEYVKGFKVLGNVYKFKTAEETDIITKAYISDIRKTDSIDQGTLDAIQWSIYEILDNAIRHSLVSEYGYVMGQMHPTSKKIAFTIFDSGQGIYNSFRGTQYSPITPSDAITLALNEGVTSNRVAGQGNGLYGLYSIVRQGKGNITITSGGGYYNYSNGYVKTYNKIPVISHENPGTVVDFQLDYSEDRSLNRAMTIKGETYLINYLDYENMEDDRGIINYSISNMAEGTGTRESALRVRTEILNIVKSEKRPISIDFTGINIISSSFADELLVKLFLELGLVQFNTLIKLKGIDQTAQAIIHRSFIQRIAEVVN